MNKYQLNALNKYHLKLFSYYTWIAPVLATGRIFKVVGLPDQCNYYTIFYVKGGFLQIPVHITAAFIELNRCFLKQVEFNLK
jgi:hypothetical protein